MQEIALFSGKIYTAGTNFTRPPVVTVATNLNSEYCSIFHFLAVRLTVRHRRYISTFLFSWFSFYTFVIFFLTSIFWYIVTMDGGPVTQKETESQQKKRKKCPFCSIEEKKILIRTELSLELGRSNKIILRWAFLWYAAYVLLLLLLAIYNMYAKLSSFYGGDKVNKNKIISK